MNDTPLVVVSRCLTEVPCRFNGSSVRSEVVRRLARVTGFIPVCPELAIGLGVPRRCCRLIRDRGAPRLVQMGGRDISGEISAFTRGFLEELQPVDAFLLKGGSPSCGLRNAPVYRRESAQKPETKTAGIFGREVSRWFPHIPAEDEGRLRNHHVRDSFLTALFVSGRWRRTVSGGSAREWRRFHDRNRLLIKAHDQAALWRLGELIDGGGPLAADSYGRRLQAALVRRPTIDDHRSVLAHTVRDWLPPLSAAEKNLFEELLNDYSSGRVPLSVPRTVVREWAVRFERAELLEQTYFAPYPRDLLFLADSGKGRDIKG